MGETAAEPPAGTPEAEAATPAPEPPAPATIRREKAPEVFLEDDDDPDLDLPLSTRLPDEDRERRLREESLDGLCSTGVVHGSAHRIVGGALFETHSGHINIGLPDSGPITRVYPVGDEDAARIRDTFVDGESRRRLVERLRGERVVVLAGHADGGRGYTAQAALLGWAHGEHRERKERHTALLTVSGDPAYVKTDDLRERTGYVLDATRAGWTRRNPQEVLRHLGHLAETLSGRFVVLTGPGGLPGHPSVLHDPPEPVQVFERWLKYELTRTGDGDLFAAVHRMEGLAEFAAERRPPAEGAGLARETAAVLRRGGELRDVTAGLPGELRKAARELLNDGHPLPQRCFLIASAVLNELPVITVSRAATLLVELVKGEHPPAESPEPPAWEWLPEWLDHAQADCGRDDDARGIRRVRLRRPHLAAAVLEVVWQEGQSVRDPVLTWLKNLSAHPARDVRIKVAHAIGRLATYDFDVIDEEFLQPWSGQTARQSEQWLAAWAFEAAAHAESTSGRVLERLRLWSSKEAAKKRTVAARAYGSRIGVDWIEEALAAFRRIVLRSSVQQRYMQDAVARSLTEVYTRQTAPAILGELARWAERKHPALRRTAALALTRLASEGGDRRSRLRPEEFDDELWPRVERHLVKLWLNALGCGIVHRDPRNVTGPPIHEAWTAFATWVGAWDRTSGRHRAVIEQVFSDGERELRGPLRLHLHHWFRGQTIGAGLGRRLYHLMKGDIAP
ncbi:hypothetical protein GCM10017673_25990 [Streptosporangium violaceochromogenes]|nr:hypothetical protein GCM10017673_25990 [Streptosporangium violaceochromogenes]